MAHDHRGKYIGKTTFSMFFFLCGICLGSIAVHFETAGIYSLVMPLGSP